jgi:hypothetical protein
MLLRIALMALLSAFFYNAPSFLVSLLGKVNMDRETRMESIDNTEVICNMLSVVFGFVAVFGFGALLLLWVFTGRGTF